MWLSPFPKYFFVFINCTSHTYFEMYSHFDTDKILEIFFLNFIFIFHTKPLLVLLIIIIIVLMYHKHNKIYNN